MKEPDPIPDCRTYTSGEIRQQIRFFERREIDYEDNDAHHYLMRYDQFFKERLPPDADDEKLRMRIWMFLNAQRLRH